MGGLAKKYPKICPLFWDGYRSGFHQQSLPNLLPPSHPHGMADGLSDGISDSVPQKVHGVKKDHSSAPPHTPPPYGYVASPEEEGCGKKAPRDDAKGHCTPSTRGLTGRSIPLCTSLIKQPSAPQKGPNMLVSFYFMVI